MPLRDLLASARARTDRTSRMVRARLSQPPTLGRLMSLWPPFLGAGIRVSHMSEDFSTVVVTLRDTRLNRNWVGTHFGGSLFAMTDAFYMIMLLGRVGSDYIVWDKRAEIEFVSPGRGTLTATFRLPEERVQDILEKARGGEKVLEWFSLDVVDESGSIVAHVKKQLYIRRKRDRA